MADESNPWQGVSLIPEPPRAPQAPVERRSPLDERTLNQAEVLAGLRGDKSEHAVRFKDLENIERGIAARSDSKFAGSTGGTIGEQIAAQFAAIDTESKALLAEFEKSFEQADQDVSAIYAEIDRLDQADADLTISFNSQIGALSANLSENYYTITENDQAIAALTLDLETQIGNVSATLQNNYYTRTQADSALSTVQTTLESDINGINATLQSTYYTKSETDSAISASMQSFQTTLNGHTTSISTLTSTTNGIDAIHGVRVDNNGHVSGFGLISRLRNGQSTSDFIINDASLRVVNSSGQGDFTPFAVYPSGRTVNGAFIPAGVHAQDLYVTRANIGDLSVDTLKIGENAVTVPVISYGLGTRTGNNSWQDVAFIIVDMPISGADVALMWNISQGYTSGVPTWGFRLLKQNSGGSTSTLFSRDGMVFGNDYPSGSILASNLPVGQSYFTLQWKGQNSGIQAEAILVGIGVAR